METFRPCAANWPSSAGTVIGALAVAGTRPTLTSSRIGVGNRVGVIGAGAQAARVEVTTRLNEPGSPNIGPATATRGVAVPRRAAARDRSPSARWR